MGISIPNNTELDIPVDSGDLSWMARNSISMSAAGPEVPCIGLDVLIKVRLGVCVDTWSYILVNVGLNILVDTSPGVCVSTSRRECDRLGVLDGVDLQTLVNVGVGVWCLC